VPNLRGKAHKAIPRRPQTSVVKGRKDLDHKRTSVVPKVQPTERKQMIELREWQSECRKQALKWWETSGDKHFVINAAPGAGKTKMAVVLAADMIQSGEVDKVIVIAPRRKIVNQWTKDFRKITGRHMMKLVETDEIDINELQDDICSTWQGLSGRGDIIQAICKNHKVMVIADEVHHAALEAAWGLSASSSMESAIRVLALTGTPIRSDGKDSVWLENINQKSGGVYTLSYKTAVEEYFCQAASFHLHKGEFEVVTEGFTTSVSTSGVEIPKEAPSLLRKYMGAQLKQEKLIKVPTWAEDGKPMMDSYHSGMIDWANKKLEEIRSKKLGEFGVPNAGAIVIAPNIVVAEYFKELIEMKYPGEEVTVVHSGIKNPERKISEFENSDKKWIVSVNMISEGVDIPRLRVMVYIPNATTELYFRQALGRIIRRISKEDNSRAYMVLPDVGEWTEYAARVELEMESPEKKEVKEVGKSERSEWQCNPNSEDGCGTLNHHSAKVCHCCGMRKTPIFTLTIAQATGYREGAISRGESYEEQEVLVGEEVAVGMQGAAVEINNPRLLRLMGKMTPEALADFQELLNYQIEKARKAA